MHGYIEAKLTYLSVPYSGKLLELGVERGARVQLGQTLFKLDAMPQASEVEGAVQQLNVAMAQLANLQKGKRPSELDSIQSRISGVHAQIAYLQKEFSRRASLVRRSALEQEALDKTVENLSAMQAELKRLEADFTTAKLPARQDEIMAAKHQVDVAKSTVEKLSWALNEKTVQSPIMAQVFDTFYEVGENVPANYPVLSLLNPQRVKVVFFVPEPDLPRIRLSDVVQLTCDQCRQEIPASIAFISPVAEFTPPIIYSRSARSKLVYRVEGRIDPQYLDRVHPGQPVDIKLKRSGL